MSYSAKLEEIARQVCSEMNVALYDIEEKTTQKGRLILISITKIGGVTVGECSQVSKRIGLELELLDLIPGHFILEVSSPGIERQLKFKKHYASAINETVRIQYNDGEEKKSIEGVLTEVTPEAISVTADEEVVVIPFTAIRKAKTYFEFKKVRT